MLLRTGRAVALGAAAGLMAPALALAHSEPGAASGLAHGFAHPFTGLDHLLAMVAVGAFAANLGGRAPERDRPDTRQVVRSGSLLEHDLSPKPVPTFGGHALWALPLTFMAMMALGGALGMAGMALPGVETGIALSVLLLGLVVALPRRWPVPTAMLMVGAFAVFHGHAHGAEMAETLSGLEYGLGFVAATGLLHLAGIGLMLGLGRLDPLRAQTVSRVAGAMVALAGAGLLAATMA